MTDELNWVPIILRAFEKTPKQKVKTDAENEVDPSPEDVGEFMTVEQILNLPALSENPENSFEKMFDDTMEEVQDGDFCEEENDQLNFWLNIITRDATQFDVDDNPIVSFTQECDVDGNAIVSFTRECDVDDNPTGDE